MDKTDFCLLLFFIGTIASGAFGGYKFGRYLERKELTGALIGQIEGLYFEGYGDAEKACRMGLMKH